MSIRTHRTVSLGLFALSLTVLAGCPAPQPPYSQPVQSDGHDHDHDHGHEHSEPTNFGEAVELVEAVSNEISDAYEEGGIEAAHGPLHEIDAAIATAGLMLTRAELDEASRKSASGP